MYAGRIAASGTKAKRFARSATMLAAVACSGLLAGCSSDSIAAPHPVAPESGPKAGLLGDVLTLVTSPLQNVLGLLRLTPQPELVRSITVDASGGVLDIPETGLRITIPRGAVSARTTITVKSLAGLTVAYDFAPHGIKFAVPLEFSQDLQGTKVQAGDVLTGGYFASTTQLLTWLGLAKVNEVLPARIENGRAIFGVPHFSGYMVSTGRAEDAEF
jgi:hypothetical protein